MRSRIVFIHCKLQAMKRRSNKAEKVLLHDASASHSHYSTFCEVSSNYFRQILFLAFLFFVFSIVPNRVNAQKAIGNDPEKGRWQVYTQAASRNTIIQFYGSDENLIYEEILPEKWVKLTRKNQIKLDKLLEQVLSNQLLISRLRTQALPPAPRLPTKSTNNQIVDSAAVSYVVNAFVSGEGKVHIAVNNPEQLRYMIQILDDRKRTVYQEFSNRDEFRRRFDITAIQTSELEVIIEINKKRHVYHVKRQDMKALYSIEPVALGLQN